MKAMISQPMNGKEIDEINAEREHAVAELEAAGYEVVNTVFTDEWYNEDAMEKRGVTHKPLCFLSKALEEMAMCDAVYFCDGWKNARGCRLENEAAVAYGVNIFRE